jgi:hypothetical protein
MGNLTYPSKTATIAASGTTSTAILLEDMEDYSLDVPTIDSGTFKIQGSVDDSTFRDIYDEYGNPVLQYAIGTGAFVVGSRGMKHVVGLSSIKFVCGAAQLAARTITLYQRNLG